MSRFELYTKYQDFKLFHHQKVIAFKDHLAEQRNRKSGEKLSKATLHATLQQLKHFFQWLSQESGYKSRLKYSDADYFDLSAKDTRIATALRDKKAPTIEQVKHVISTMPTGNEIELRNRALIAFTLLTGARDSAIASMKLKHVDLAAGCVFQDARDVKTKFSKTFTTYFLPVGDEIRQIVAEWVTFLREKKQWGNDDPLFPATHIAVGSRHEFEVSGLERKYWKGASPIRTIFREAFERAELPYFNPHSFRDTLARFGEAVCKSGEQWKAWSQNFGHENVLTTFISYGEIPSYRQGEIIRALAMPQPAGQPDADQIADAVVRKFRDSGTGMRILRPDGLQWLGALANGPDTRIAHQTKESKSCL